MSVPEVWLGKDPVTQAQYQAIMGQNPSRFSDNGANRPVERASWQDAVAFCQKLSQKTGRTYRLPSEAEWEYACRAETTTPFYFGETISPDLANYHGNYTYGNGPKGTNRGQTTEVDNFRPMPLACTTCMAMFGNGAPTTGTPTTRVHQPTALHGYLIRNRHAGCCGVVLGTTIRGAVALPVALTTFRWPANIATSVFVLSVLPPGLFSSPLPFSAFVLFTSLP